MPYRLRHLAAIGMALGLAACATHVPATPETPAKSTDRVAAAPSHTDIDFLFHRIWRVTRSPSPPAQGSIYIFLPNGTLLETSCSESYRIATWTRDEKDTRSLHVVEDHRDVFTATMTELNEKTLHLQQKLTRGNQTNDLTLTGVEQEFVCPDRMN
jgi:hypothetical protein